MITILIILLVALTLYAVLGGADFGAGVWEFNTAFKSDERERDLLYHAIGPVWETNHVWLIFVLVLLFGAFPPAFAALNQALFLPLFLALVGIVFRGAAYAFRSQLKSDHSKSRIWAIVFGVASVFAPFFLGAAIGAMASGQLQFDESGAWKGDYLFGWINPLSIFSGFFNVGMCAFAAATYMIRESRLAAMKDIESIWRFRALWVGAVMGVLAIAGLVMVWLSCPLLWEGMQSRGWPAIFASILAGFVSLWAIATNRVNLAVTGVTLTCGTFVVAWGLSQYPYILPPFWTAEASASPASVLNLILIATAVGAVFLVPALILLFMIFKSQRPKHSAK